MSAETPFLSPNDFTIFREYFYKKTGIDFDDSKRYFVDKRLLQRMEATRATSFRDYFVKMRFEAAQTEFQNVVNLMTVNETYFYREDHQFSCLINSVLGELVEIRKRRKGPLRILSLPCSTGEEPYSIALHLIEDWPLLAQHDVELAGADIDTQVLKRAGEGIFRTRSLQHLPPRVKKRHFSEIGDGQYQISADIRDAIHLFRINLSNPDEARSLRNYDVIFCRNMLIYFDDRSRIMAANTLYDALNPGGFLFLGHSESMSRMSSMFTIRKFPDAIVYQRPLS